MWRGDVSCWEEEHRGGLTYNIYLNRILGIKGLLCKQESRKHYTEGWHEVKVGGGGDVRQRCGENCVQKLLNVEVRVW